jgi:hypothetical protein
VKLKNRRDSMTVQVVGVRKVDFTPDNGNPVKGTRVYYLYEESGVEGYAAADVFINETANAPATIVPGQNYIIEFNNRGRFVSMSEIPK